MLDIVETNKRLDLLTDEVRRDDMETGLLETFYEDLRTRNPEAGPELVMAAAMKATGMFENLVYFDGLAPIRVIVDIDGLVLEVPSREELSHLAIQKRDGPEEIVGSPVDQQDTGRGIISAKLGVLVTRVPFIGKRTEENS